MTKDDLINQIVKKVGISKREASESLNVILEEIAKALSQGQEVILTGFGKFLVAQRKEKIGINPQTKERIKIPALKIPRFKAGRTLKEMIK